MLCHHCKRNDGDLVVLETRRCWYIETICFLQVSTRIVDLLVFNQILLKIFIKTEHLFGRSLRKRCDVSDIIVADSSASIPVAVAIK